MKSADEILNEAADKLAATLEQTDPRAWRKLLIYCPDWLIKERSSAIDQKHDAEYAMRNVL